MPNGHRQSFRLRLEEGWEDRDERDGPPSPIHSSDSEETYDNKIRWAVLARWVLSRWRTLGAVRLRYRRAFFFLDNFRFFHALPREAVDRLAMYM
jgi:hypothetical protein